KKCPSSKLNLRHGLWLHSSPAQKPEAPQKHCSSDEANQDRADVETGSGVDEVVKDPPADYRADNPDDEIPQDAAGTLMYHTLRQIADDNSDDDPDPEKAPVRHLPYRMKHNTTRECRLFKIAHMGPIRELLETQRALWTRNSTPTDPRI